MTSKPILNVTGADTEQAVNNFDMAMIPIGSIEYHGPHAPLGTDSFIADELVKRVSEKLNVLVFPLIAYTSCPMRTVNKPGTVQIDPDVMTDYLESIFRSLLGNGIKGIMVLNAHDGNIDTVKRASDRIRAEFPDQYILLINWWETLSTTEIEEKSLFSYQGGHGHGGPLETSAAWAVAKDSVDLNNAPDIEFDFKQIPMLSILHFGKNAPKWPGYHGWISESSPEKGEVLLNLATEKIINIISTWLKKGS